MAENKIEFIESKPIKRLQKIIRVYDISASDDNTFNKKVEKAMLDGWNIDYINYTTSAGEKYNCFLAFISKEVKK